MLENSSPRTLPTCGLCYKWKSTSWTMFPQTSNKLTGLSLFYMLASLTTSPCSLFPTYTPPSSVAWGCSYTTARLFQQHMLGCIWSRKSTLQWRTLGGCGKAYNILHTDPNNHRPVHSPQLWSVVKKNYTTSALTLPLLWSTSVCLQTQLVH